MDRYEYMRMDINLIPDEFIEQYKLRNKVKNGYVYMEIRRCMYGLPQAGMLANRLLKERLAKHGYFELPHTPGLWRHATRPVWFTLVVDDFGIKYVGKKTRRPSSQCLGRTLHNLHRLDWQFILRHFHSTGTTMNSRSISPCPTMSRNS